MKVKSTINNIYDNVQVTLNPGPEIEGCPDDGPDVLIRFEVFSENDPTENDLGAFVDFYLYKMGNDSSVYRRNIRVDFNDHWDSDDREAAIQLAENKFREMKEYLEFPVLHG